MEQFIYISNPIHQLLIPVLIGSKMFFSLVVAPNTFINLNETNARIFIRSIFPKLYLWCLILSLLISIALIFSNPTFSFIFFLISIGYLYSRQFLMQRINEVSDKKKKKEHDKKTFKRLHNLSVSIFIIQLILMTIIYFLSRTQLVF